MAFTLTASLRHEGDPVKGSRFIVDIAPVATEAEARELLANATKDYPDASHHCWAWRIASPAIDRASDDGEPSGSAGRPILAQLAGRELVDAAAVVTRYFGGTKLGVGGLVRAYGSAAGEALDLATSAPWVAMTEVHFEHDYALTDLVARSLEDAGGTVIERDFGAVVTEHVRLPVESFAAFAAALADATAGQLILEPDAEANPW